MPSNYFGEKEIREAVPKFNEVLVYLDHTFKRPKTWESRLPRLNKALRFLSDDFADWVMGVVSFLPTIEGLKVQRREYTRKGRDLSTWALLVSSSFDLWGRGQMGLEELKDVLKDYKAKLRAFNTLANTLLELIHPAPAQFKFENFTVYNDKEHPVRDVEAQYLLQGIASSIAIFKKRGLLDLLYSTVGYIRLVNNPRAQVGNVNWAGLYISAGGDILLNSALLIGLQEGRLAKDWIMEVFVHEFGHHIHLHEISREAREYWDSSWERYDAIVKEKQQTGEMVDIPWSQRRDFWRVAVDKKGLWAPYSTLTEVNKVKYRFWLAKSGFVAKDGSFTIQGRLLEAMLAEGIEQGFYNEEITAGIPHYKVQGHIDDGQPHKTWDRLNATALGSRDDVWKLKPGDVNPRWLRDVQVEMDRMTQEYGIASEYGKTNVKEDFAESFVQFMVHPEKMNEGGLHRMKRTLWLSGFGGKPIMERVATDLKRALLAYRRIMGEVPKVNVEVGIALFPESRDNSAFVWEWKPLKAALDKLPMLHENFGKVDHLKKKPKRYKVTDELKNLLSSQGRATGAEIANTLEDTAYDLSKEEYDVSDPFLGEGKLYGGVPLRKYYDAIIGKILKEVESQAYLDPLEHMLMERLPLNKYYTAYTSGRLEKLELGPLKFDGSMRAQTYVDLYIEDWESDSVRKGDFKDLTRLAMITSSLMATMGVDWQPGSMTPTAPNKVTPYGVRMGMVVTLRV